MLAFLYLSMVRVDGIEPTTSAWKADVLPLNYTRFIEVRKMPPSPLLGQDRNSEKSGIISYQLKPLGLEAKSDH